MEFKYENSVICLPSNAADYVGKATKKDIQILLKLAQHYPRIYMLTSDESSDNSVKQESNEENINDKNNKNNENDKNDKNDKNADSEPSEIDGGDVGSKANGVAEGKASGVAAGEANGVAASEARIIAELTGFKPEDIESSLRFWRAAGVIAMPTDDRADTNFEATEERATDAAEKKPKKLGKQSTPVRYNSGEIANVLEGRDDLPGLIDECQRALGKVFNSHEIAIIISMLDYLGIEGEYIIIILTYCKKINKISIHYAEKIAYNMYDSGIYSAKELQTRLAANELAASIEGKVRGLFGLRDRALTTREVEFIANWASVMKYDMAVIKRAYEITVNATSKPSLAYANAILEKWNSQNLRTVEDIDAMQAQAKKDNNSVKLGNSFDTDEFFEAALKRSLGEE